MQNNRCGVKNVVNDTAGRVAAGKLFPDRSSQTVYDARNRDIQCTDTHGDITKKVYDAHNNVVTMIDALNHNTTCVFDARDRKISCTDRIAGTTNYVYDANNNLQTLTDAQGGATSYVFDVRNLLQSETFPDGRSRFYGYDASHRIVSRLDQAGVVTNYVYDRANRMTTRAYPDSLNDTFSYDNASRLTLASSARYSNSVARVYDAASRLTVETLTVGAASYNLGYGYDADNRQTAVVYPDGSVVDRTFTNRNQLKSASYNGASVANFSYDDGRRKTSTNFGNNLTETRSYRNDNLIASIATAGVDTFTYTWDSNKRKLTQTETGIPTNDQTYSYDSEDRLTNFARTNGDAQSWNLSLVGDWNNTVINGTQQNRTHNAVHELLTVNTTPLTYDVKGNITANSNGQVYAWDVENRLAVATDGFNTLGSYTYDALGRRISKTVNGNTTVFVSSGMREVCEYTNGALSQSYVFGSYIDEPLMMIKADTTKLYYHSNNQYSVSALTDQNGIVVERYKYDPYGEVTILATDGTTVRTSSNVNNPWTFTGRRLDAETGLMYYRARTYSYDLGTFISRDPIGYEGGINLHGYCGDMPTKYVDPSGLYSWTEKDSWDDKEPCTMILNFKINITEWLPNDAAWNEARKTRFKNTLKTSIENTWNNKFKAHSEIIGHSYKPLFGSCEWVDCPCARQGFALKVNITVSESSWTSDKDITVKSNPISTYSFIRSNSSEFDEMDNYQGLDNANQVPSAHEFGHMIGLNHPGYDMSHLPINEDGKHDNNSAEAYSTPPGGKDINGNTVSGNDLMGSGMVMRAFYYEKWADELKRRHSDCGSYRGR